MKKELEQTLYAKYPGLFRDNPYGFGHADGWYEIIDDVCGLIVWDIEHNRCPPVTVDQVKEKFGTLRFYYSGGNDVVQGYVNYAEHLSEKTCEECGERGVLRKGGWIRTLCDKHAEGREPMNWPTANEIIVPEPIIVEQPICDQYGPICDCGYENIAANAPIVGGYHSDSCNVNKGKQTGAL